MQGVGADTSSNHSTSVNTRRHWLRLSWEYDHAYMPIAHRFRVDAMYHTGSKKRAADERGPNSSAGASIAKTSVATPEPVPERDLACSVRAYAFREAACQHTSNFTVSC